MYDFLIYKMYLYVNINRKKVILFISYPSIKYFLQHRETTN